MGGLDDKIRRFLDSRNELLKEVRQEVGADYHTKIAAPRQRLCTLEDKLADLKQQKTVAEDKVKRHWGIQATIQAAQDIIRREEAKIKAECDELNALEPRLQSVDSEIADLRKELYALKLKRMQDEEELLKQIREPGAVPAPPFREDTPSIIPGDDSQSGRGAEYLSPPPLTPQSRFEEGNTPPRRDLHHGDEAVGSDLATPRTTPITGGVLGVSRYHQFRKRSQGIYSDSDGSEEDGTLGEVQGSKRPRVSRTRDTAEDTTLKTSGRTIPFDDVFANGQPKLGATIIEYPPKPNRWLIPLCKDHTRCFDSLASAIDHLCQGEHEEKNCSYEKTHQILGVWVSDCTAEKAKRNNDAVSDPKNQSLQYRSPRTQKTTKEQQIHEPHRAEEEGGGGGEGEDDERPDDEDQWGRELERNDGSDPSYRRQRGPRQEITDQNISELIDEVLENSKFNVEWMSLRPAIEDIEG